MGRTHKEMAMRTVIGRHCPDFFQKLAQFPHILNVGSFLRVFTVLIEIFCF